MNILFYVEPLIEQDKPYWKDRWISVFVNDLVQTLEKSEKPYTYRIITNEAIAQKVNINVPIIQMTQKELLEPFSTTNYLDVTSAWHLATYTRVQLLNYHDLISSKLKEFIPDIVITFSPVPFLQSLFPYALILHHEFSIFSRLPYPRSWFLDPIGTHSNLFLNKFEKDIKSIQLNEQQQSLIDDLKKTCKSTLDSVSPVKEFIESKKQEFDYLVLLPLQFSRYYSFDDLVPFKSQYEYCVYVLDNIPKNIGIVVNVHPDYPIMTKEVIEFLKSKYPNLIYDEIFDLYTSGQFIVPYVDAVITVSSSIGLQTLLFDKKLITLSDKTYSFVADETNIRNIENILKLEYCSKDNILYYILTHYAITKEYLHDPVWLDHFLSYSLEKFRNEYIQFSFYDYIDDAQAIFQNLTDNIINNMHNASQNLNIPKIQLTVDYNTPLLKKDDFKYPITKSTIQEFCFDVSKANDITSLRLKLFNKACVIEIDKFVLLQQNGDTIDLIPYIVANDIVHHHKNYFFPINNPSIDVENLQNFKLTDCIQLQLAIRYLYIGEDALHICIQQLANDKEYTKKELDKMVCGNAWNAIRILRRLKKFLKSFKLAI